MPGSCYNNDFNPRRYEKHLSLFGRKVLENLVKTWVADHRTAQNAYSSFQSRVFQSRMLPTRQWQQSKKVLTFMSEDLTSSSAPRPSTAPQPPLTHTELPNPNENTDEEPFEFNTVMKHLQPVPTSNELFRTISSPRKTRDGKTETVHSNKNSHSEVNITTYEKVKHVPNPDKDRNLEHSSYSRPDTDDHPDPTEIIQNDYGYSSVTGPNINWDNMFDTELFSDVAITNAKLMIQQNAIDMQNTENRFDIAVPTVAVKKDNNNKRTKPKKVDELKQNEFKNTKRKNHPKGPDDIVPTKIKKTNETDKAKISFNKQKYTETVKNWLNDVDPNNPVDEEIIPSTTNIKEKNNKNTSDIQVEKNIEKPNKKVVQAQLANKDGKMKFKKPKDNQGSEITSEIDSADKTKENKPKTKFVAPIKSQLPVKDVAYDVIILDNMNIVEHAETLCLMRNRDLINILVYSNGFSQLNNHHTEDKCNPEGFFVNNEERFYYFKGVHQSFRKTIESILANNKIICYEGKNLLMYFKSKFDLEFNNLNMFDVQIGGSLIDPENPPENFSDVQKLLSYTPQYTIATECVLQKTAWYATLLSELATRLTKSLQENELLSVFEEIEMKLVPIIADMELRGVTVDLQKLKTMEGILLAKMKEVEQECYKAAGKTFQINSAVQIRNIVYDELQLDTKCNIKIKETIMKGAKSTSETMLRSLVSVHPLPKLILEYRHLHKAHATFLTGIAQQVKDGVVRPTWVQTAAATGRIASNNPNLQAIPKAPFSLILFPDDNNSGNETLSIRSVYTSRAGRSLLAADFQHIECRVFAHCAGDGPLLHALRAGGDLFRALAAKWLNKPEGEVTSDDRERTKRMVYASLYGAGCRTLMDILGAGYEQTLAIIASFNRTFPSLKRFGRAVVDRCERSGGRLATASGRARRLTHIGSQQPALRAQAERQAVNFVVQGSAADICKMAMVVTAHRLRSHSPPVDGRLLLQIHDELVWEIRDDHLDTAAAIIKAAMEGCGRRCGIADPLPVAVSTGRNWGEMAPYAPTQLMH